MNLSKFILEENTISPFQIYLLSDSKVKALTKEFDFYDIIFYKEECAKKSIVTLQYPTGNMYWYIDFNKYIETNILSKPDCKYADDWKILLLELKIQIKHEIRNLKLKLDTISTKEVIAKQLTYNLRDYQAFDLAQLLIKYNYWDNRALLLSDPRTGKSRIALAASIETLAYGDSVLIVCPKTAQIGWVTELQKMNTHFNSGIFYYKVVDKISGLKKLDARDDCINVRIISYDLFKKFTIPQIRQLTSKAKHLMLICDEVHRLRNFKTQQSESIFNFKKFCVKDKVDLGILGLTGTIAVKNSVDVFGSLSLINDSKIRFKPYYDSFDIFKEYFYHCEDTSFGKKAKTLKRADELNYVIQTCSVQTKQKELSLFVNYKKEYKKVVLKLDDKQKEIYNAVARDMEYSDSIDCQNKLVQLVRLQQICITPNGLVPEYDLLSPKVKWVVAFALKNNFKFIVACKKTTPLKHIMSVFNDYHIKYTSLLGEYSYSKRLDNLKQFEEDNSINCMFLQLDTGREALTLPMSKAMIFLDRDFAQGYNEQAEARITPVHGESCTKYIIDLVMENTKEEEIYQTLVVRKKSIDAMNFVFKKEEE